MQAAPSIDIPPPHLAKRHQTTGLNDTFQGAASFPDYLSLTHSMLLKAHQRLDTPDCAIRVSGNMPFLLKPAATDGAHKAYRRGILLTHGLTDSPYFMRHLAAFFQAQGYLVMAVLLPGHGTQPGDLLGIEWQEWAKAVVYGTECLAQQADEIYLGGLSTGATLSLYQSMLDPKVRGLFLFSPALQISRRAAYAHLHKSYSWLLPAAKWLSIQPDTDCYKYESFPKNAAAQMHALTHVVQAQLRKHGLRIPVFAVASGDDTTVQSLATLAFMEQADHPANRLVWYSATPPRLSDSFPTHRLEWLNSAFPEQRILSSAHTAIVLPASDAHYGLEGDYSNCAHYYPNELEKYIVCRTHPTQVSQGEITPDNLQSGIMRRLMYNPSFSAMTASLKTFISSLTTTATKEE
jgi:esterase/lipase